MSFTHVRFQSRGSYGVGCGCGCGTCGPYGAAGGSVLGAWLVPAWAYSGKKYGTCPGYAKNYDEWKQVVAEFKQLPKKFGLYSGSEADRLGNKAKALEQAGEAAWQDCKSKQGLIDTEAFQTSEDTPDNTIVYAIAGLGAVAVFAGTVFFIRRRRAAAAATAEVKV